MVRVVWVGEEGKECMTANVHDFLKATSYWYHFRHSHAKYSANGLATFPRHF